MSLQEFDILTDRLRGEVRFLYFHLMGEPLLHTQLPLLLRMAKEKGFVPVLTTNGTLFKEAQDLLNAQPHKIQISLHSHEGNERENLSSYMKEVMGFATTAAESGIIVVLRLWNQGGYDRRNQEVLHLLEDYVPVPWTERADGYRLRENLYLEYDQMFQWPDAEQEEHQEEEVFCYALRNQIGILADGSVVPCCLDHEGSITLGNLFQQSLSQILSSPRAKSLYDGFTHHNATEPLCKRCGYAAVTKRFRRDA